METIEAIRTRRSVRKYRNDPVAAADLDAILDAGRLAATARNIQPWEFIAVTDPGIRGRLADLAEYGKFLRDAPVVIAVVCRDTKYYLEDGAAATQNLLVAAHALGYGSCWVAGDKKDYAPAVLELLAVPGGGQFRLVSLVAVGRAAGAEPVPKKRPPEDCIHRDCFGRK